MLSAQLQQSSSLNAVLLKNHKFQESYLFTPQQARLHDLDAVFQLAQNGLHLLATSSKQLKSLNSPLFAPSAKFTDRTRISVEENAVLDAAIEKLLYAISPFLMEQAASKIVEWLVRRYR
jgi:U3 small nucleolar RNA-associated protein 10